MPRTFSPDPAHSLYHAQMGNIYDQASVKLHWAEEHIKKLEAMIDEGFRKVDPSPIGSTINLETGERTYYVKHLPLVDDRIPLIAGDVLHSLRCALDYTACALARGTGAGVTPKTKFPIARSAKDFPSLVGRLLPGLGKYALESLQRIQPYNGGNAHLWHLHCLNNRDKHELLLTMGLIYVGRSQTASERATMQGSELGGPGKSYTIRRRPTDIPITLHTGQELLTVPASEAQLQVGFRFDVALDEPSVPRGFPLTLLLSFMGIEVDMAINELYRFCK